MWRALDGFILSIGFQADIDGQAMSRRAIAEADRSLVRVADFADDGQPEAAALAVAAAEDAVETLENVLALGGRNAGSVVADG